MAKSKSKSKSNNNKKSSSNRSALSRTVSQQNAAARSSKSGNKGDRGILGYFRGVKQEFKKVVWPTREELGTDTVVVIAVCAFFSLAFWLVDTGFLAALKQILGITLS